jgi:hypothetical protein
MAANLKQQGTATAVATPVTPAFAGGGSSSPGSLLILAVVVTGTSPTVTTPAGWTQIGTGINGAALTVQFYSLFNNAGGIASVAVTLAGTVTGAVASIFEFAQASPGVLSASANLSGTGTSYGDAPLAISTQAGELLFYMAGFVPATLTPNNSSEWSAAVGTGVQGILAQLACFWGVSNIPLSTEKIGGSFSASVANAEQVARFTLGTVPKQPQDIIGGQSGIYVPSFYSGQIGG